jgi:beta-glucosidase
LLYAKGCNATDDSTEGFREALEIAVRADVVIVGLGEPISMIGEGHSRAYLDLPGKQLELLQELNKTGKPIVVVLLNGRPLLLDWLEHHIPAIVEAWHLGHQSGNAIADVLFGDCNPSGKLTVSFPVTEGQIPVYYSDKPTGRPFQEDLRWCTHYIDAPNDPLYPFGYGLSYTEFDYSGIRLDQTEMNPGDTIVASVTIRNTGDYDGEEIVQMYIRDMKASVTRPVKELKGFEKIWLNAGEEQEVSFAITEDQLRFYDKEMNYISEPGEFKVFIGTSSRDVKEAVFILSDSSGG